MTEDVSSAEYWEQRADAWDRREGLLERFAEDLGRAGLDALAPAPGERVLDVGCGPGATTLELAARVAPGGAAVGLDIAHNMVRAAERRAAAAGVGNVGFVVHDLEQAPCEEAFDAAYSRFGVMFFRRPDVAFANLVASLRPGGRLAAVVWAPPAENPWMSIVNAVAAEALGVESEPPTAGSPGPFSLCDGEHCTALLAGAGLEDVAVEPVHGRLEIRHESARFEVASMLAVGRWGEVFTGAGTETRDATIDAVLGACAPYRAVDGWELPGRALVLRGNRPG